MSELQITTKQSASHQAEVEELAASFFNPLSELGEITPVAVEDLSDEFQSLLAHSAHMTMTLEAYHESLVDVHVVAERHEGDNYSRHSTLTRQSDDRPVQSGVMRIDLAGLPSEVRKEIEKGSCPLGRILIRGNVLREVELLALWRITVGPMLGRELNLEVGVTTFGRTARILVAGRPAVELLEIVKP